MCIIASAAKKRYMKREEVIESMKVNSSGFFMAALRPDGSRDTIRTLDFAEALEFFDKNVKEEDAFVMHARIPSRGPKTIENVHGWECDGILFMHNMTITDIDDMMKRVDWKNTDSEFFFRKIFIPYYRGFKDEAYKDGKFHPDIDNIIRHFVGHSNKFCFIMPDNNVIRYGTWVSEPDRKENGEIAFYASNSGYKVYSGSYVGKGGSAAGAAGFRRVGYQNGNIDSLYGYDEYDYDYYGYYATGATGSQKTGKRKNKKQGAAKVSTTKEEKKFNGKALLELAGVKGVCQLAMAHLVLENAIECRSIYSEDETEEEVQKTIREMLPDCYHGTLKNITEAFSKLAESAESAEHGITETEVNEYVAEFAAAAAYAYEEKLCKEKAPYAITPSSWSCKLGIDYVCKRINMLMRMTNLSINFKKDDPATFAVGYVMDKEGASFQEIYPEDLLSIDSKSVESLEEAVRMILSVINDTVEKNYPYGEIVEEPHDISIDDAVDPDDVDVDIGEDDIGVDVVSVDTEEEKTEKAEKSEKNDKGDKEADEEDVGLQTPTVVNGFKVADTPIDAA